MDPGGRSRPSGGTRALASSTVAPSVETPSNPAWLVEGTSMLSVIPGPSKGARSVSGVRLCGWNCRIRLLDSFPGAAVTRRMTSGGGWLTRTGSSCLTAPEAGGLKSWLGQDPAPCEVSSGDDPPSTPQASENPSFSWLVAASHQPLPRSSRGCGPCVCTCPRFPLLVGPPFILD